jgi:hypothetical protein
MGQRDAKDGEMRMRGGYLQRKVVAHEEFGTRWISEHYYVWWKYRKLRVPPGHILHHKDGNKLNNKVGNLRVMTAGAHTTLHKTGHEVTASMRARISAAAGSISDETRAKMSTAKLGKKLSAETRAKMSESGKRKKLIAEHRAKIGNAVRGKKRSPETCERCRQAALKRAAKRRAQCT